MLLRANLRQSNINISHTKAQSHEEEKNKAGGRNFARRRIFDARLALTLRQCGVTHFATANVKRLRRLGFRESLEPAHSIKPQQIIIGDPKLGQD